MTPRYAKTYINRLVKKYKSVKATAYALKINPRYIYMLQKEQRRASSHLIHLMKILLEK